MGTTRTAATTVACLLVLVTGCGSDERSDGPDAEATPTLEQPDGPVFEPGARTFPANGEARVRGDSTLLVGRKSYDLSPTRIDGVLSTPYGVFVRSVEGSGIDLHYEYGYFDGTGPVQDLPDGVRQVVASESGDYVGWVTDDGPEVESHAEGARSSVAVLVDAATGEVLFQTTEALLEGADYPDEYTPEAYGFRGDTFYWGDAYSGEAAAVDAATLQLTTHTEAEMQEEFGAFPPDVLW